MPWRLVLASGSDLVVEVKAGGPPCDAVTGLDVAESEQTVSVAVWAGKTPGASCPGQPAVLGTFWIRVPLAAPIGQRQVRAVV